MFDEQDLLTLSYGLVALLSELDHKRRKFYVRWIEAAEEEEAEAMDYYDKRIEEIRNKVNNIKSLLDKLNGLA